MIRLADIERINGLILRKSVINLFKADMILFQTEVIIHE